ncbi:hypothetical protein SAMN04488570_1992 [Nocardioides scoriae]|uniref:DUF6542 domain-containing protein n=1 Tax=Nocardioides scoriae TaxID=642780 RepID=A0A1H1SLX2_9ACTN|nr:DUF6542 domain-containing protein [Nocardioides scoriae]SDS48975.1 hypothetical protein SAMN04488570_1992 [Nocardioides scoriae]
MSAPTLWEEGHLTGGRVTRLAVLSGLLLLAVDIALFRDVTALFDLGFVAVCVAAALGVRPADFFRVSVLPPLLLLGLVTLVAVVERGWVARESDSVVQAVVSGLAHHAGGLMAGYALALLVLLVRMRVRARHGDRVSAHSNRAGSPAPTRVTSG